MKENKQLVASLQKIYIDDVTPQRICRYCFKEIEKGDFCSIRCKGNHQSEMRTGKAASQKVKDTLKESQDYLEKKWKAKKNSQKEFSLKHPNYRGKRRR